MDTKDTMTQKDNLALPCIDSLTLVDETKAQAKRWVNPAEPFFKDHFTGFAVLPGVLQLEGMVQTASWWIRQKEGFKRSQIRMVQCKGAKFVNLVRPEETITFEAELLGQEDRQYKFKAKVVRPDGTNAAQARFVLESLGLEEGYPAFSHLEEALNTRLKGIYNTLLSA